MKLDQLALKEPISKNYQPCSSFFSEWYNQCRRNTAFWSSIPANKPHTQSMKRHCDKEGTQYSGHSLQQSVSPISTHTGKSVPFSSWASVGKRTLLVVPFSFYIDRDHIIKVHFWGLSEIVKLCFCVEKFTDHHYNKKKIKLNAQDFHISFRLGHFFG